MKKIVYLLMIVIMIILSIGLLTDREGEIYVENIIEDFQYLDNRNDLLEWNGGTSHGLFSIVGDYIHLEVGNPFVSKYSSCQVEATLEEGISYTLLYKIVEQTGTSDPRFVVHSNGFFDLTDLNHNIGIYKILLYNDYEGTTNFIVMNHNDGTSDYMEFRAVLIEGDLTDLTDSEANYLIMNEEYGDFEYDISYTYIGILPIETRVELIVYVFPVLVVIGVIVTVVEITAKKS